MAVDYLTRLPPTGEGLGAAAYHDKRFSLLAALEDFDTALYVDADSRLTAVPRLGIFPIFGNHALISAFTPAYVACV